MSDSKGELFSRVYLDRGAPTQDNMRFRLRMFGYLEMARGTDWYALSKSIKMSGGFDILGTNAGFKKFFLESPVVDVLDFITLHWRDLGGGVDYLARDGHSSTWLMFVRKALVEENLGYRLDDACGVHYFVDEEFSRNRISALQMLDAAPLAAVCAAFETAHRYLDPGSRDTKASVRSAFEALESLARLMFPDQKNLNRWVVENKLKPTALAAAKDETEKKAVASAFDGLADVIDGIHLYRHGQPVAEMDAPSLELTVFYLSLTAAALRWMAWLRGHPAMLDPVGDAVARALAAPSQGR